MNANLLNMLSKIQENSNEFQSEMRIENQSSYAKNLELQAGIITKIVKGNEIKF